MTSKRIAQTNQQQKSEISQGSGILQRAAVRSTDDNEPLALSNSGFSKDFSQVPISPTKPQQFQVRNPQSYPVPPIQAKLTIGEPGDRLIQRKGAMTGNSQVSSEVPHPNKTGLPDRLKTGIENLSGYSMDDVRVHYNSNKPTQLQAHAYAQGTDIHVAREQEKHLPHEAWHVVQQKQGRVKPTLQMKGFGINDDIRMEKEADVMGGKALQTTQVQQLKGQRFLNIPIISRNTFPIQRVETNLQKQQGPSCWLYVLEAVAKAAGISTTYISMVMKSYPESEEAEEKKKTEENDGKTISKRAAALKLIVEGMTQMIKKLEEWEKGEGGKRAEKQITKNLVKRYARQTLKSDNSVEYIKFNDIDQASVEQIKDEYKKAQKRAEKLAENTITENDDVAKLLNTGYATIDNKQELNDVHFALSSQKLPSYVSIRKRFKMKTEDFTNSIIDKRLARADDMENTNHAILLDEYDSNDKVVIYKDPNYGNVKIKVTYAQFQSMAGNGDIKLRPFFKEGSEQSKLAELEG